MVIFAYQNENQMSYSRIILLSVAALCSCQPSAQKILQEAEKYVDIEPDRTLTLLEEIDTLSLTAKSRRKYCLTQANAKIVKGVYDADIQEYYSLINDSGQGDRERSYYMGKLYYDRGLYKTASVCLISVAMEADYVNSPSRRDSVKTASSCLMLSKMFQRKGLLYQAKYYAKRGEAFSSPADSLLSAELLACEEEIKKELSDLEDDTLLLNAWEDHTNLVPVISKSIIGINRSKRLGRLVLLLSVGIICFVLILIVVRRKKKNKELAYLVTTSELLRNELKDKDSLVEMMSQEMDRGDYLMGLYVNMFQKEFREIGNLCNAFLTDTSRYREENIYNMVEVITKKICSKKETQTEFEKMLNRYLDNVMVKVRTDFPDQDEPEYRFIGYCIAGFSASFIAVLLPDKYVPSIYMKKTRVVRKLIGCGSENVPLYKSLLLPASAKE